MSSVKIQGDSSGTGVLTIAAPNTNTDRTLSLPDNTGDILTTASTTTPKVPIFSAYLGSTQSIPNGTFTKVNYNTEIIDSDGWYDTSNYRFTPQQAGYYSFTASVLFQFQQNNAVLVSLFKNNSETDGIRLVNNTVINVLSDVVQNGTGVIHANGSTDYFEIFVYHNYGSSRNIANTSRYTRFQGYLIRAD